MASRKNSSRLPASSFAWIDNPVALPPGFARLATRPLPTGSIATANTMGIDVVVYLTMGTAHPEIQQLEACPPVEQTSPRPRCRCATDKRDGRLIRSPHRRG